LDARYENGTVYQKRKIIGSIFPEKLTFDGSGFRTTRINEAVSLLCLINKKLDLKENGTNLNALDLSHKVTLVGLEHFRYVSALHVMGAIRRLGPTLRSSEESAEIQSRKRT